MKKTFYELSLYLKEDLLSVLIASPYSDEMSLATHILEQVNDKNKTFIALGIDEFTKEYVIVRSDEIEMIKVKKHA